MPVVFRSSVILSIHLFLGRPLGRFPTRFHSKATRYFTTFSSLFKIWPSHWILWPLMKLVTGAGFVYSIICIYVYTRIILLVVMNKYLPQIAFIQSRTFLGSLGTAGPKARKRDCPVQNGRMVTLRIHPVHTVVVTAKTIVSFLDRLFRRSVFHDFQKKNIQNDSNVSSSHNCTSPSGGACRWRYE